jgi:hypothetical protein
MDGSSEASEWHGQQRVLDYPIPVSEAEEIETLMATVERLLREVRVAADSELARELRQTGDALLAARAALADGRARRFGNGISADRAPPVATRWPPPPLATLGLIAVCSVSVGFWLRRSVAARRPAVFGHLGR